jgi:phosphoribosylanthranilate isomerase
VSAAPKIKVCGLTRAEDARLAVELGAWALGFVFHAASPRATTPENAGAILKDLDAAGAKKVGVFVNAGTDEISRAIRLSGIDTVQLHGEETPEFCAQLKRLLPGISIIRALRPKNAGELSAIGGFAASCESVLLDSYVEGARGGTGVTGDWTLAALGARDARIVLAGGLHPENVAQALKTPCIYAIDVSSGLEEAPGRKSAEKMKKFFENARTAHAVPQPEKRS